MYVYECMYVCMYRALSEQNDERFSARRTACRAVVSTGFDRAKTGSRQNIPSGFTKQNAKVRAKLSTRCKVLRGRGPDEVFKGDFFFFLIFFDFSFRLSTFFVVFIDTCRDCRFSGVVLYNRGIERWKFSHFSSRN